MNFSENLKLFREKKGYSKVKMAKLLNIPYTSYNNYEIGREPKVDIMLKMARLLDISLFELIGESGMNNITKDEWTSSLNYDESEINLLEKYRTLSEYDKATVDTLLSRLSIRRDTKEFINIEPPLLIPYYGKVASAGTGQYIFNDIPPEMIEIENNTENIQASFAIGVNGDSMEPTYKDGDTVLVKKQDKINIGEIGIFMIDGEAFVKELGNGVLISHNKTYEDIKITLDTQCLGIVIGAKEE